MSTGNYELGAFDRSIEQTIANKIIERHIYEAHGSIHHLQYLRGCKESIWSADDFKPVIDTERLVLTSDFPYCPPYADFARPNVLMFGDREWQQQRSQLQAENLHEWNKQGIRKKVAIELEAGHEVPTIRMISARQDDILITGQSA